MKKKYFLIVGIILFFILILGFIFVKSKEIKVDIKDNPKVSIYDKVYNTDYIKIVKNGKIKTKKKVLDTSKLGKKKVTIVVTDYFKNDRKFSYILKIVDTEKPIIKFNQNLETTEGVKIDLLKDVSVSDNSKEEIKVEVSGDYDFNKAGKYTLYYLAEDSSGNKAKEEFTLVIKEKPKTIIPEVSGNVSNNFTTSKGFKGYTKGGITYIDGYLVANKTYPLPSTYNPGLNSDVISKANQMFAAAKKEGLNIYISSGFRSYNTQKTLYNNYVNRDGKVAADTYSARPGHSEHQTGLAFDVNQISSAFDNTPEAKWLANNCYKFGFILRYPKGKDGETGYRYESWHFRYVGNDLASKLYNGGNWITMESYFGITSKYNY